jgi:hypothetical protein
VSVAAATGLSGVGAVVAPGRCGAEAASAARRTVGPSDGLLAAAVVGGGWVLGALAAGLGSWTGQGVAAAVGSGGAPDAEAAPADDRADGSSTGGGGFGAAGAG